MAHEVGPVDLRQSEEHPFLGREIAQPRMFSQQTAHEVDQAVRRLITEAEQKAAGIIGEHRQQVEHLVDELERHETLDCAQSTPVWGRPESARPPTASHRSQQPDAPPDTRAAPNP